MGSKGWYVLVFVVCLRRTFKSLLSGILIRNMLQMFCKLFYSCLYSAMRMYLVLVCPYQEDPNSAMR